MSPVLALIARDVRLAMTGGTAALVPLLFFIMVAALFPFAIGPQPDKLILIAPGVTWVAALLASLLSLDRLVQPDADDGSLDQFVVMGLSLEGVAVAKTIGHWLTTGLPLIIAMPLVAVLLQLPGKALMPLALSLLIGTPALSALATLAAGLTCGIGRGGVLAAVLVLPLALPVLIFGVSVLDPLGGGAALKLLGAASLIVLAVSPFGAAAALRVAVE
jgi:heme exporter protein B